MNKKERDAAALALGAARAESTLARREKQRRTRRIAEARLAASAKQLKTTSDGQASAVSAGVLVAEGDSWFDYPLRDVLRALEDEHAYDVESVAHYGDRVEDMAYGEGQLDELSRQLEKVLRSGKKPRAILISGGGNDIAGDDLAILLNHASAPERGVNDDVVRGVIEGRLRHAYVTIIAGVTAVAQDVMGEPLPIIIHGYDYPVPDGRGFLGFLAGPWLEPSLRRKGYLDLPENKAMLASLIDRFNTMLSEIPNVPTLRHVHYLDLRQKLSTGSDYKKFWANELHPTPKGFSIIAAEFARLIEEI